MTHKKDTPLSDEELVALCKERLPGDPRPFTALVNRYQQRVLASCFRLMSNRHDAADQAQEVFIRVYRGIHRFEERAKFSTWLYRITINTCRTALAKRARRPLLEESPLPNLETQLPVAESPESAVLAQAEIDLIEQALRNLSTDEQTILILRETDGLSYQEIADVLEIGLSAAKMRVMRARLALQRTYHKHLGAET